MRPRQRRPWRWSLLSSLRGISHFKSVMGAQLNLIETIGSGATINELTGTEAAPGASAQVVHASESDKAFLILRDLPLLASGQEFEIWSIREGVPSSVGTFAKGAEREQLVSFSADMSGAQNIGISIEPKNGSPTGQPTGPIVLLGPY